MVSPSKQKKQIKRAIENASCENGALHFLLPMSWWRTFKNYTNELQTEKPGKIDNKVLIDRKTKELLSDLEEDEDYYIVPKDVWDLLISWYVFTKSILYFFFLLFIYLFIYLFYIFFLKKGIKVVLLFLDL